MADLKTLEQLATKLHEDGLRGYGIQPSAARSIAGLIEQCIGAPLSWPSRVAAADAAMDAYPGSPEQRLAFNAGAKWAVERYAPTVKPAER